MEITTKTNGYTIGDELDTMVKRFEYCASVLFPEWELEEFYYGEKLVMATIRGCGCEYCDFNITAKRVSLNGHTLTRNHFKVCEGLTWNDECHEGRLLNLVNF